MKRTREQRQRVLQWKSIERSRTRWYRAGRKAFKARFTAERKAVSRAFKEGGTPQQGLARALLAVDDQAPAWEKAMVRLYRGVSTEFAPQALQQLQHKALIATIWSWLTEEAARKVKDILETTRVRIQEVLSAAIEAGETIDEMTHPLEDLYEGFATQSASQHPLH